MKYLVLFIIVFFSLGLNAQDLEIAIINPSFEGNPHRGVSANDEGIKGWYDCGQLRFRGETPPDLHPIGAWQVTRVASEGDTYLGMVVRDNDTWESLTQRLELPVESGKCYSFNIDLARSRHYISGSKKTNTIENYTEPAVLRIYGGTGVCGQQILLGESVTVSNEEWRTYEFKFEPSKTVNYLTLEAFYKTPSLFPYNGHLLLDNASLIKEIPCDDEVTTEEEIIAVSPRERPRLPQKTAPVPVAEQLEVSEPIELFEQDPVAVEKRVQPKKSTIPGLYKGTYTKGDIIRVKSIEFQMDKYSISSTSSDAITELYDFMKRNKDIVIEIGGHTNTAPDAKYCDQLSSLRAKEVAKELVKRGVSSKRLYYKGYGKRKPIVIRDTYDMEARKKNQRVEIKILRS